MDNKLLVNSIRELCKKNKISISKLESDLNFGAGLISRWAKSSPSIDKIIDIADYFHISLDEVVGYHGNVDDKFLEKLILKTEDNTIKWKNNKYNKHHDDGEILSDIPTMIYLGSDEQNITLNTRPYNEMMFFVKINNVFISLYGYYIDDCVNPINIKLFIQPDENPNLIEQDYSNEQLKVLWLKVLYSSGDQAPSKIRVEEFKNSFINDLL